MSVDPRYLGMSGFVFPTPLGGSDYPAEGDVREGVSYGEGIYTGTLRGFVGELDLPTPLDHSPASIVQALLILKGGGTSPMSLQDWPVFSTSWPDRPDSLISAFNTQGFDDGRTAPDNIAQTHHGFMVKIRALDPNRGWVKANQIRDLLSQQTTNVEITIGANKYWVCSVSRIGNVLDIGKETPASKRNVYTINALITIRVLGTP